MFRLNLTVLALVFILTLSVVASPPWELKAKIKRRHGGDTYREPEWGNKPKPCETPYPTYGEPHWGNKHKPSKMPRPTYGEPQWGNKHKPSKMPRPTYVEPQWGNKHKPSRTPHPTPNTPYYPAT